MDFGRAFVAPPLNDTVRQTLVLRWIGRQKRRLHERGTDPSAKMDMMLEGLRRLLGERQNLIQLGLRETRGTQSEHPRTFGLYNTLIRTRMREQDCPTCERSLEAATLIGVTGGTTLQEYGLSDTAAAKLLAFTQCLSVRCQCGVAAEIGIETALPPQQPPERVQREGPWHRASVELYQTLIRARMREHECRTCGQCLESASLIGTDGGTILEEHGLSETGTVRVMAFTQRLSLRCARCGRRTTI